MSENQTNPTDEMSDQLHPQNSSAAEIESLVNALSAADAVERQRAREALVSSGKPAVVPLIESLRNENRQLRWEAAKTLVEICDVAAVPALVETLGDEDSGICWVAGGALIELSREAVVPVLKALIKDTRKLRNGAYHVLHCLAHRREDYSENLLPVVEALQSLNAEYATPVAAEEALRRIAGP